METFLELETWRTWTVLGPLMALTAVAAITDARERIIPNTLTYPSFFVGLVAHGVALGWAGLGWGLATAVTVLIVGIVLMILGWMGGGDVKLLTAVGALVGFGGLGEILFYSVFVGSALGLVMAAFNGYLWKMLARMGRFLWGLVRQVAYRTKQVGEELERDERSEIPFGIAVCIGTWLAYTEARFGWPGLWTWFVEHFQGV
jgi:prepilin peptidase CpaA